MADKILDLAFKNLTHLQRDLQGYNEINLAGNNLSEIDLSSQLDLQTLNLSFNNLNKVWRFPQSLLKLEINNNIITAVSVNSLPKSLLYIDFSSNFLNSVEIFGELPNLTHLFLKNNHKKIKQISSLSQLKNIKEIDLECNEILDQKEILTIERNENLVILNLTGNPVIDSLTKTKVKLSNLQIVENHCYCRSEQMYMQSIYYQKKKQSLENEIDLFDELGQDQNYQSSQKQPEFNISSLLSSKPKTEQKHQQDDRLFQDIYNKRQTTKSLSPLNQQQPIKQPAISNFQTSNKKEQYRTFQDVFKTLSPTQMNLIQRGINPTGQKLKTEQDQPAPNYKKMNEQLIKDRFKLEKDCQYFCQQNETFFKEIEIYKSQLVRILTLIDPQLQVMGDLNIRLLLDTLETKLSTIMDGIYLSNQKYLENLTNRVGKKINIFCKQVQQKTIDDMSSFNHKIIRIDKKLEKLSDYLNKKQQPSQVCSKSQLQLNLVGVQKFQQPQNLEQFQSQTARHMKTNSDIGSLHLQPQINKGSKPQTNLYLKPGYRPVDQSACYPLQKKTSFVHQKDSQIETLLNQIRKQESQLSQKI